MLGQSQGNHVLIDHTIVHISTVVHSKSRTSGQNLFEGRTNTHEWHPRAERTRCDSWRDDQRPLNDRSSGTDSSFNSLCNVVDCQRTPTHSIYLYIDLHVLYNIHISGWTLYIISNNTNFVLYLHIYTSTSMFMRFNKRHRDEQYKHSVRTRAVVGRIKDKSHLLTNFTWFLFVSWLFWHISIIFLHPSWENSQLWNVILEYVCHLFMFSHSCGTHEHSEFAS